MELKIKEMTFPEVISFNFEELKQEITEKSSLYKNLVYTDDDIKTAKSDKANLNKFVKALSDERIKVKKQCLAPYEEFEKQIKELSGIVEEAILNIDSQVKAFEEDKKAKKLAEIMEYFNSLPTIEGFEELKLEKIYNPKWLNASVSLKSVCTEISERLAQIMTDLETLSKLPEFSFEAVEVYKQTLDINKAISEGQRLADIQKRKAEAEAEQARQKEHAMQVQALGTASADAVIEAAEAVASPQPEAQWIKFEAQMTVEQALKLKAFFEENNIEFRAI